jgi:hypothetical protein
MGGRLEKDVRHFVDATPHTAISPVYHSVTIPSTQLSLFDFHGNAMKQSRLGFYFELVGRGLYGGSLYGSRRSAKRGYPTFASNPDTVDLPNNRMREHKACSAGSTLILRDEQIKSYLEDQRSYPAWDIRSVLFRHGLKGIRSFEGSDGELFSYLGNHTLYGLNLPLSVLVSLHEGHKYNNGTIIATRSENKSFPWATRVSKGYLNQLFFEPEKSLNQIDLDPTEYSIRRDRSPRDFSVDRKHVAPFPILTIEHTDPARWIKEDLERHLGRVVSEDSIAGIPF